MIVRLIMMNFGPGMQSEGEKVADKFAPIYKTFKGFKNATFFFDYEVGTAGSLTLWESKEDADAASAALRPQLQEFAGGILKGPPTVQTFKLYEPKA